MSHAERVLDAYKHICSSFTIALERCYTYSFVLANPSMKMFATLLMCSTMITQTTPRIISIVLVVLAVLVPRVLPLLFLQLTVSFQALLCSTAFANLKTDSKQARDLVSVLTEAKQQIDPRLAEMARYGGGGGGGRYGGGGYRGGRGGGRGGGGKFNPFSSFCSILDGTNKGPFDRLLF